MHLIAPKTIAEAATVITELLTRYHGEIDKALKAAESEKLKVSIGITFTADEAKVAFSFVGEKINISSTFRNVQGELELPKADKIYTMGTQA